MCIRDRYKAKSILSHTEGISFEELFSAELSKIMEDVNASAALLQEHGLISPEFFSMQKELFSLQSKIVSELAREDFSGAKKSFSEIREKTSTAKSLASNLLKEKALKVLEIIEKTHALSKRQAEKKIAFLNSLLNSVDESELINAKYVLPITKGRIKKIESRLGELYNKTLEKSIEKFRLFLQAGDFENALSAISKHEKELDDMLSTAFSINNELDTVIERIKEDAAVFHNSAVEKFNNSEIADNESEGFLKESEDFLEKENYLKSIVSSAQVAGFTTLQDSSFPFNQFIFFIPIVVAIILIITVRKYRERAKAKKEKQVEKVLSNW